MRIFILKANYTKIYILREHKEHGKLCGLALVSIETLQRHCCYFVDKVFKGKVII
jgi:hypothetical protein